MKFKISKLQLDPNGICNSRCWYCPVKYLGNPSEGKKTMSIELLEKILKDIIDEREKPNGIVNKNFNSFFTAHYNEVLLYPFFEDLLKLCRKYGLMIVILSNGTTLVPEKVDLIKKYTDCIREICLNIPAFDADTWSIRTGMNIKLFDKLILNIQYFISEIPQMVKNNSFSIKIHGVNENSFNIGWLEKGKDFPLDIDLDIENGEFAKQIQKVYEQFPNVKVFTNSLIDRAGLLNDIISNKKNDKNVTGCLGRRTSDWLHINANGDAFLCCNDYNFEHKFGNFNTQKLNDFWNKPEHIKKIKESQNTICRSCSSAIFDNTRYI